MAKKRAKTDPMPKFWFLGARQVSRIARPTCITKKCRKKAVAGSPWCEEHKAHPPLLPLPKPDQTATLPDLLILLREIVEEADRTGGRIRNVSRYSIDRLRKFIGVSVLMVLAVLIPSVARAEPPLSDNLHDQVAPMYESLVSGGVGSLVYVGDSIPFRHAWGLGLNEYLWNEWGTAGWSYRAINQDFKWTNSAGVNILKAAFIGDVTKGTSSGKRDPVRGRDTPDGIYSVIRTTGAITLTIPAGYQARLHYSVTPDGGTACVDRPNVGGVDLTFPTFSMIRQDVAIDLPSGTKYTLTSLDGLPVQVNGIELRDGSGFRSARLGRGQNGPNDYNTGNTPSTASVLVGIDPDVVVYMQDWFVPNQSVESFKADTRAYVTFVRATCPGVGIVFIAHHAMSTDSPDVSQVLWELATELGCGFIDNRQMATYTENVAAGRLQADGVHLTNSGGKFFAERDAQLMREAWGR